MLLLLHRRSRQSYDVVMTTGWLVSLLCLLSVTSAFSAAKTGDRWRRPRIIDGVSDGQIPSIDVERLYGLDGGAPVVILANDGQRTSFGVDEYPSETEDEVAKGFHPEAEYLLRKRDWQQFFDRRHSTLHDSEDASDLRSILRADKRRKSSGLRHKLQLEDIPEDNSPKPEVDDNEEEVDDDEDDEDPQSTEQLTRDYVDVARSTNAFVRRLRRPMTSSAGSLRAVVDTLVVVDNELYRRTLQRQKNNVNDAVQDIKKYYSYVIALVDSRYSQIQDSELSIRIRLAGIFIAQGRSDSPWSERHIHQFKHSMALDPNVGLEKFQEWLKEEHRKLPKFDHAIGFTGYTLVTTAGKHTSGMAYIGTICKTADGYACSIIQEDGGLSSVSTAVHEMGHGLGAKHDGEGSNGACPATRNYIMAPGNSPDKEFLKNFFLFSPCTIREFKSVLSSEDGECLFDSVADKMSVLPGQMMSPDAQCKDVFGQDSGLCNVDELQSPEEVCTRLWCLKPGKAESCVTRGHLTPVLGTPCADGKVCKNGQCLHKTVVLDSMKDVGASETHTNRASAAPKPHHRPHASTEKPVKTELDRPKCKEDTSPSYCRANVYVRPDLCQRQDMAAYCCYSCSFV